MKTKCHCLKILGFHKVYPKPIAVFPSRLAIQKGLPDLILATRLIIRERKDFKLLIVGRGREDIVKRLMRIASRLNLKDNIIMTGYVSRRESFLLRRNAKLTLYPSHADSYSYSVAESLLMGVPVVAYDTPALKLNYGDVDGLYLVRESDVEALAQKVLELLEARDVSVGE
ncbi:MAG: glycosyltransferase family 4 protein, partial [Acidilobaceae archaeon]